MKTFLNAVSFSRVYIFGHGFRWGINENFKLALTVNKVPKKTKLHDCSQE